MQSHRPLLSLCLLALTAVPAVFGAPGAVDPGYDSAALIQAHPLAVQGDGKVFFFDDNSSRVRRLDLNGTVDTTFPSITLDFNRGFSCGAVQRDGKLVLAGTFGSLRGTACVNIGRLDLDGSFDAGFDPTLAPPLQIPGNVLALAVQPDGKIVVAGTTRNIVTSGHRALVRLNPDGSVDAGFVANVTDSGNLEHTVEAVALQADGKLLIGGEFTGVNGVARTNLVRLNADGTLDGDFAPVLSGGAAPFSFDYASIIFVQGNGGILIAGPFTEVNGVARDGLARLHPDGSLDTDFAPVNDGAAGLTTLAVQADGKILIGGAFLTSVGGTSVPGAARLNPDGTLDISFVPDGQIDQLAAQGNGGLVISRDIGGFSRIRRLLNDTASESLACSSATLVEWKRGGGAPEITHATFTLSIDAGATWTPLGSGTRVAGGWTLGGQTLPVQGLVRAQGQTVGGTANGSVGLVEQVATFDFATLAPVLTSPAPDSLHKSPVGITFTLPEAAQPGSVTLTFDNGSTPRVLTLASGQETAFEHNLQFDPANPVSSSSGAIDSGGPIPDGTYTVTLSYRDAAENSAAAASSSNVKIDSTPPGVGTFDGYTPLVIYAPQGGTVTLPDYASQALSPDGDAVITQDPPVGTPVGEGFVTVTVTATDPAGNTSVDTVDIEVRVGGSAALAVKGGTVPNDNADVRIPTGSTWATFGVPSINMNGTTAGWMATVRVSAKVSFQGIFHGSPTAPKIALRTGDIVTDVNGDAVANVLFKSFREPVFSCDEFAVLATIKGTGVKTANDTGIWFGEEDNLFEVAREGTVAAGTSVKFKAFTSLAMPTPGVVGFTATLAAPAAKDMGLWVWTPNDGLRLALREGDTVDLGLGGDPTVLKSFKALTSVKGSPGHGRYDGNSGVLDVLLTLQDGTILTAIVAPDATVFPVRVKGDQDIDGHTLATLGVPSSPGPANSVTRVTLALDPPGGITKANNTGIYDPTENVLRAQTGQPAAGAEPAKFKTFLDPVAGLDPLSAPVQAFAGTLSGTVAAKDTGIWAYTDATGLRLVAREGNEPEDVPGTKWKTFTSLSVLEARGVMFTATLASGTAKVKTFNDAGLWATDSTGALKLILRESQEVLPGKFLRSFDVLKSIAGSPGQRRAWTAGDASARIIYRAFFTDGSSAIVSTAVP